MSLTVRHLNGDATFLLIFSPEPKPSPEDLTAARGAFTIVTDPWISEGPSIVSAPWFAITKRVIPSAISHLQQIEEPDVVLISQNKPDHCHKETLLQLNPEGKTLIVAEPGAAKAIKTWHHFDPTRVRGLDKYNHKVRFGNSMRIRIPPLSSTGHAGEVNISFIPAKNYMTGLHNAYGITYRAPTRTRTMTSVATIDLPKKPVLFHMPLTASTLPPSSPPPVIHTVIPRPHTAGNGTRRKSTFGRPKSAGGRENQRRSTRSDGSPSSDFLPNQQLPHVQSPPPLPTLSNSESFFPMSTSNNSASPSLETPYGFEADSGPFQFNRTLPTPPESPASSGSESCKPHANASHHSHSISSISSNASTVTPGRPKPLSVLYTPHGLPLADLQPYIQNHLVAIGAMPLSLMFQAFDRTQNPWFLGGNIMLGSSGGVAIARGLMARCWLSAHDEPKDDRGFSVFRLKTTKGSTDGVRKALWEGEEGDYLRKTGWSCDVRTLPVGGEMLIGQERDLCAGMEKNRESRLMKFDVV